MIILILFRICLYHMIMILLSLRKIIDMPLRYLNITCQNFYKSRNLFLKKLISKKLIKININSMSTLREDILFRQLFDRESCTYTYIIADKSSREAVIIDPVIELVKRDLKIINELQLILKFAINTHIHADHITGTGLIKCLSPKTKSLISKNSGGIADVYVNHGDGIKFGKQDLKVFSTPGHTNGCVTYVDYNHGMAFTGDALLIRGCGRTDFQEGSAKNLYTSVHNHILNLPDDFLLYPAHDYNGNTVTTVGEEKKFNPRLAKSEEDFIQLMEGLNLSYPKKIDESLPANKVCGLYNLPDHLTEILEEAKHEK